ncbi:hypothetical protein [Halospina sp. K52047b]|uniref:hypothetical protein n=1 Tax=Halospina sp. K52047b TaxID=2614160 RepID=UPI00124A328C|nr:hypothetical protein [Halospina sp. K52047b]KAA8976585.1 hypothetical protein F3089_15650 [Halospina sp. K52047b]
MAVDGGKFKAFVRYMINAAKQKRCVPYYELENIFGLSHELAGKYAGALGDFCAQEGYPPLNGLIISSTDCIPSYGFDWYQEQYGKEWGKVVRDCWARFHVKSSRAKQTQDFGGLDKDIAAFLES